MEGNIRYVGANVLSLLSNMTAAVHERMKPTPTVGIPESTGSDRRKSEQICGANGMSCGEAAAPINAHPTLTAEQARIQVAFNAPVASERTRPGTNGLSTPPVESRVFSHGPATSAVTAQHAHHMASRPTGKSVLPKMKMAPVK
jgi:hypothetical protein